MGNRDQPKSQESEKPVALLLMGPTASGKTDLAMAIADRCPVRIISVDSAMVYRGMNIGTAKPEPEILRQYPHALVDIYDACEPYSVARFLRDARAEINQALSDGATPLLVGGTMLYFRALLDGLSELPAVDPQIRVEIEERARLQGWPALHEELQRVDPATAVQLHPNHSARIQRALEVWYQTGKPLSQWYGTRADAIEDQVAPVSLALLPSDRASLHQRIEQRMMQMLDQGLVAEVEHFYRRPDLHANLPSMRSVGYRQVWEYLEGSVNWEEMKLRILAAHRQLAKRQLTWLRSWPGLRVLDTLDSHGKWRDSAKLAEDCLKFL